MTSLHKQPKPKVLQLTNSPRRVFAFLSLISLFCFVSPLFAQSKDAELAVPNRGAHMAKVEAKLGAPMEKIPPVGKPPIARWVYRDFTVYFEGDRVIHSVSNELKVKK